MSSSLPKVIALTGGIGSGKSTVAELFAQKGARIIDADLLAREVVEPGTPALQEIQTAFGNDILNTDGTLNRRLLANIIFADQHKREMLESILHPRIRDAFVEALKITPAPITLYVVPLFFESKNPYPEIKKVIVVSAPMEVCLNRIIARDHISPEEALLRVRSQLPIEEKVARADWVIENNSTPEALHQQVEKVYSDLVKAW